MKLTLKPALLSIGVLLLFHLKSNAQITLLKDYVNNNSAAIGTFQGINFKEAGFSGIYPIPNSNGKEFWIVSDRGVNVDCANANLPSCRPTYDKMYAFPSYSPKIHRVRVNGDSIQILQTISIKRPNGTGVSGILNPTGLGSTNAEVASTDTVLNCANFNSKIAAKDIWGIDSEGIVVDKDGNFWLCEEGGPTIWKLNRNGVVMNRFTPYANLSNAETQDIAIDTVFKYRKNNRGFEGIAITPNGKIYAIIQSPILYPTKAVGEATRVHRILEIDPSNNSTRMFAYLNDGPQGSGSNQIRFRDWKIGDMVAINNNEFLVIEAGARGISDVKKIYRINISNATPVTSGLYGTQTLEALVDATGLAAHNITPVSKTLFLDLLANGWPAALDKAEGLSIINDSTIAVGNDNDYGQTCPNEDGIAIATSNKSHIIVYGLQGPNKIANYVPIVSLMTDGVTGPSTSQSPYVIPMVQGGNFTSLITAGEKIGNYTMCGTPDGLGAFDNGDGTFTVLMNHEFGNTSGAARAHGSKGTFVSKWVINKSDLSIVSGSDLIQSVNLWNGTGYTNYNSTNPVPATAMNRFCSADLPAVSAFYNSVTGLGTQERIFMNGEESGNEGRAFGHIVTGAAAGTTYELPALGKYSWENSVACPTPSDNTIVVGMDDSTPGQVYVYIGTKTSTGTDVEKAGLTNGKLYGVAVSGMVSESSSSIPAAGTTFSLVDLGDVKNTTGSTINTTSNSLGVTTFLRPEDGAWDPSAPKDFYFATTNAITSPSRLWRLRFTDLAHPEQGGTIEAVLDGTEGQKMLDNLTIDHYGHVLLVEDVGGNAHIGRVLQYDIATDVLTTVAEHDRTRFLNGGANYLTQDEEASGILDVQEILGPGMFLVDVQAHYSMPGELVEGGQLLAFFNPDSYNANPEVSVLANGALGTVRSGTSTTTQVTISNAGPGALKISDIRIEGANAGDYSIVESITYPLSIAAGQTQTYTVEFNPTVDGTRNASLVIVNNDFDEAKTTIALSGTAVSPQISVKGNNLIISNGTTTIIVGNNTSWGNVKTGKSISKSFTISNTGTGNLVLDGVNFSGLNSSDFSLTGISSYPFTLAAGASQTVTLNFNPQSDGIKLAKVTIDNDDSDDAAFEFAIGGIAVSPEVQIMGNSVSIANSDLSPSASDNTDFGNVIPGSSTTKSFVIKNNGLAELEITGISFSGTAATNYVITNNFIYPFSINPGKQQTINVQFSPAAIGVQEATIVINNDDANETSYEFALKGTGASATGVTSAAAIGANELMIYPNPAGNEATVFIDMQKEGMVKISILDAKGNEVSPSMDKNLVRGKNEIVLNTANLENGIYYVQLTVGKATSSIKAVVVH